MKKRLFAIILTGVVALSGMAQVSKTLSPYSQFGLGILADQSQGANRAMNGLGIGLRDGTAVNVLNPASYSVVDSLTMIFDMGVSGQITNFEEGGKRLNRKGADFDYAVALFRVMPKMGVSFGVIPFTNVGYSYSTQAPVGTSTNTQSTAYSGTGGLSQAFIGAGWEVVKGLSIGANFSYLWGDFNRTVTISNSDAYVNTISRVYESTVSSYKLDFGVQFQHQLNKNDVLTIGATMGMGHKLGADAMLTIANTDPQTAVTLPTTDTLSNAYRIPMTFGIGATWVHKNCLTVGVDYMLQKWGAIDYPMQDSARISSAHKLGYVLTSGLLKDRHKLTVGADWIPDRTSRRLLKRVHYRLGASYATPYYNIKGQDGPKELSVSGGFGIPIANSWNNRSVLNVSAQWVRTSAGNFITENAFRINIGLTFNERWFAKWKVD